MGYKETLGGIVVLAIAVVVVVLLIVAVGQVAQPINSGTYEGQKIDYSHQRGFVFKTNDLTTKTNDRSSTREDWCVPDNNQELVDKVRDIDEGDYVRIEYYRPLWIHPDTCAGQLKVITSISSANNTNG